MNLLGHYVAGIEARLHARSLALLEDEPLHPGNILHKPPGGNSRPWGQTSQELSDGSVVFRFGDVGEMPGDELPVEVPIHSESSKETVSDVDLSIKGAGSIVPLEVTEEDWEEEADHDAGGMPADEPPVEASVNFEIIEEIFGNVDFSNVGAGTVVPLEVIEEDQEEEADHEAGGIPEDELPVEASVEFECRDKIVGNVVLSSVDARTVVPLEVIQEDQEVEADHNAGGMPEDEPPIEASVKFEEGDHDADGMPEDELPIEASVKFQSNDEIVGNVVLSSVGAGTVVPLEVIQEDQEVEAEDNADALPEDEAPVDVSANFESSMEIVSNVDLLTEDAGGVVPPEVVGEDHEEEVDCDVYEMPEGEPPVEASVNFKSSKVIVGNVDLSNEDSGSVVPLEAAGEDHKEEADRETDEMQEGEPPFEASVNFGRLKEMVSNVELSNEGAESVAPLDVTGEDREEEADHDANEMPEVEPPFEASVNFENSEEIVGNVDLLNEDVGSVTPLMVTGEDNKEKAVHDASEMPEGKPPVEASVNFDRIEEIVGNVDFSNEEVGSVAPLEVTGEDRKEEADRDVNEKPEGEPPFEAYVNFESSEEIVGNVDLSNEDAGSIVPIEVTEEDHKEEADHDANEMPESKPPVEVSVIFDSIEEIIGNEVLSNESAKSLIPLEVTKEDHEEEVDNDRIPLHALTKDIGSDAVDASSGVFPEEVEDQLSIHGNSDLQGDSHLVAATTLEGIELEDGPFQEIQLKSEASSRFASDLSIEETGNKHDEEDFTENSPEVSQSPVLLASDAVTEDNSSIEKNDLGTYLTIQGELGVTSDIDQAGDSLRLEKPDAIAEGTSQTSIGFDAEIANAVGYSEEQAKVNISNLPNEVEEEAGLNLANDLLSGQISHQSAVIPSSSLPEVEPSPSKEETDDILIDAPKEDINITLETDDATSLDQEEEVENGKADAGFGVAVLVGHEEIQTEKADVKRKEALEMELCLASGVASLPHPSKESAGGDDVHFVRRNWLGIADGVGLWSMEGSGSSAYARELLENCLEILSTSISNTVTDPVEVVLRGARETHSSGLSTVMVASFDGQVLQVAGIGDSGFIVIRNGDVLEKSMPMLYEFNLPIQMHRDIDPSQLIKPYSVRLDEGDVIVLATNGLFDNLYDREIALIVSDCLQSDQGPDEMARVLAQRAREVGISESGRSPFADAAHATSYVGYSGGKLDDVTVVVSLVGRNPDS
ncbi:hypothetical protein MLD38_023207 [Melastoma candidum]|uniref:Uncharacterized protein n=1 Tax=Melastoma candidum TaxID=119954 RepID=A0ACB9QMZ0_9MYRT|nr:hypothetical protein MLD38_023207 [Melastoma candidum]